jgi:hypothetical protein
MIAHTGDKSLLIIAFISLSVTVAPFESSMIPPAGARGSPGFRGAQG